MRVDEFIKIADNDPLALFSYHVSEKVIVILGLAMPSQTFYQSNHFLSLIRKKKWLIGIGAVVINQIKMVDSLFCIMVQPFLEIRAFIFELGNDGEFINIIRLCIVITLFAVDKM
jgi:hypothetical protein